ncbi:MAG: hypothetical protein JXB49_14685 [Bacteroidales bacterium]|nr:hypothetical protein [Bacteroidales bacterium]
MKYITLLISLTLALSLNAQKKVNLDSSLIHLLAPLDLTHIESGMLLERGFPYMGFKDFNGLISSKKKLKKPELLFSFNTAATMHLSGESIIKDFDSIQKLLLSNQIHSTIPIGGFYLNYNSIYSNAEKEGLIKIENNQVHDLSPDSVSIFEPHIAFVLAPLILQTDSKQCKFSLVKKWFSTNIADEKIKKIEVDFDDGYGFRTIKFDKEVLVTYKNEGCKTIKCRAVLKENKILLSQSTFIVNADSASIVNTKAVLDNITTTEITAISNSMATISTYGYNPNGGDNDTIITVNGLDNSAKITIDYGEDNGILDKPLIIIEGFDPSDIVSDECIAPVQDYAYFIDKKLNIDDKTFKNNLILYGYDIIHVDFQMNTDHMANNAQVLKEVINWVNNNKHSNALQNVIIGQSMGGMIARYALCQMENDGVQHDVRLFVSFDSGHEGVNQVIGVQYMVDYTESMVSDMINGLEFILNGIPIVFSANIEEVQSLREARELLNTPAAKELSINHIEGSTAHNNFYSELNSLGMPQYCTNIAIANGTTSEFIEDFDDGGIIISKNMINFSVMGMGIAIAIPLNTIVNKFLSISSLLNLDMAELTVYAAKGDNINSKVFKGQTGIEIKVLNVRVGYLGWEADNFFTSKVGYDRAPGSYAQMVNNDCGVPIPMPKTTFVLPSSALAIAINNNSQRDDDLSISTNGSCTTPFDNWYIASGSNQSHVEYNVLTTQFIWNHMEPQDCAGTTSVLNRTINCDEKVIGCDIVIDNVTINDNNDVTIDYSTSLEIQSDFETKPGVTLEIK